MTNEEIKANKPEGATHSVTEFHSTDYIKYDQSGWYVWQNKKWVPLHPIVVKGYLDIMKPI